MLNFGPKLTSLVLLVATTAFAQGKSQTPVELVRQMTQNELADRDLGSFWMYHIEKTVERETTAEAQVETSAGPVFKVLSINGRPLTAAERKADDERIQNLLRYPSLEGKVKHQHDADEDRVKQFTKLLPDAFLFDPDGMEGANVRLKFRPNPAFNPPTFEMRAFHGLTGTLLIEPQHERLVRISGHYIEDVEFGYGFLGRIDKGGTFEVAREPVTATHWKTSLVDVHVSARLVLFKTISKQQREVRSDFHPVPKDTTLQGAVTLLAAVPRK